jgi:hypothetical protein
MVIINNVRNNNLHLHNTPPGTTPTPQSPPMEWQEKLLELLQYVIKNAPPRQLSRHMRTFFLLYVADLKTTPPNHEEIVLHFVAMLELMDIAEDEMS